MVTIWGSRGYQFGGALVSDVMTVEEDGVIIIIPKLKKMSKTKTTTTFSRLVSQYI